MDSSFYGFAHPIIQEFVVYTIEMTEDDTRYLVYTKNDHPLIPKHTFVGSYDFESFSHLFYVGVLWHNDT